MKVLVNKRIKYSMFPTKLIRALAETALENLGEDSAELSVSIVGERTMRSLNKQWLNEDRPTDVLAFPMREGEDVASPIDVLGDVIICEPVLLVQARKYRHSPEHELVKLLVHGILHLVGYDHSTQEEKTEMDRVARSLERKLYTVLRRFKKQR